MKNWHQLVFYNNKMAEGSKLSQNTRRKRDKNARNFNLTRAISRRYRVNYKFMCLISRWARENFCSHCKIAFRQIQQRFNFVSTYLNAVEREGGRGGGWANGFNMAFRQNRMDIEANAKSVCPGLFTSIHKRTFLTSLLPPFLNLLGCETQRRILAI